MLEINTLEGLINHLRKQKHVSNDRLIDIIYPLLTETLELHHIGHGQVFNRTESILVINGQLHLGDYTATPFKNNLKKVDELDSAQKKYLKGYDAYEKSVDHHDPKTDIYILGLVIASVCLNINFELESDLDRFILNRRNLSKLNPKAHPVLLNLIDEMTDLDRTKRPQTLVEVLLKIDNYKDFNLDAYADITLSEGFSKIDISVAKNYILESLKNQLFDISKRNNLFYYKDLKKNTNLTELSIDKSLGIQNVFWQQLIWKTIAQKVERQQPIYLESFITGKNIDTCFKQLQKLRRDAQNDQEEYGFNPLKLVSHFLYWHKDGEPIKSPLLLIPIALIKQKRSSNYRVEVLNSEAEINPILVYFFKKTYKVELPNFIDLGQVKIDAFIHLFQELLTSQNTGISLRKNVYAPTRTNDNFKTQNQKQIRLPLHIEEAIDLIHISHQISSDITSDDKTPSESTNTINSNPYQWTIDGCSLVIGNFNYKKISLVKDYEDIYEYNIEHPVFDTLFSTEPVDNQSIDNQPPTIHGQYHTLPSDNSQLEAIYLSKDSYVIQGPPGTGKSQTITNIITQKIAQGQRVLFVCEKKAALDVVYSKLKQLNLDQFATFIHDAQGDKKAFVHDLESTVKYCNESPLDFDDIKQKRASTILKLNQIHDSVEYNHYKKSRQIEGLNKSYNDLLDRNIALKDIAITSHSSTNSLNYADWEKEGTDYRQFKGVFAQKTGTTLNKHSFRKLNLDAAIDLSKVELEGHFNTIHKNTQALLKFEQKYPIKESQNYASIKDYFELLVRLMPLQKLKDYTVLKAASTEQIQLSNDLKNIEAKTDQYVKSKAKMSAWSNPYSRDELDDTIQQANNLSLNISRFFQRDYWRFRNDFNRRFNFDATAQKEGYIDLLLGLKSHYDLADNLDHLKAEFEAKYGLNYATALNLIQALDLYKHNPLVIIISQDPDRLETILDDFQKARTAYQEAHANIHILAFDSTPLPFDTIVLLIEELREQLKDWPMLQNDLKTSLNLSKNIQNLLRTEDISPDILEKILLEKEIQKYLKNHPESAVKHFEKNNADQVKIETLTTELLEINIQYIQSKIAHTFKAIEALSLLSHSKLTKEEKDQKMAHKRGVRLLNKEFKKKRSFKTIRELATTEAEEIISLIKPVWLMSPLSVADALPIDTKSFDVVIFDEASQIKLAEGIPAIFRAKQTIIVGDEMQLPPTQFFNSRHEDTLNDSITTVLLDAQSLLTQAKEKMPSQLLNWHYRSKYESLISYSNAAFYKNRLQTIPNIPYFTNEHQRPPIQFHYIEDGLYTDQKNKHEARYIAHLTIDFLLNHPDLSLGIVAFSRQQQKEIEKTILAISQMNPIYAQLLEQKFDDIANEQEHLFIKNLENVQGDERDVMIISTCYGFNRRGKLRQNFGPINRKGGINRLNVIFTRAKQHIALVSSMKSTDLTNTYNEGTLYLKNYLGYAESVSNFEVERAATYLDSFIPDEIQLKTIKKHISKDLSIALEALGYQTKINIGNSSFKCDLGIKGPNEDIFNIGILLDYNPDIQYNNTIEKYQFEPQVLRSLGWTILFIFITDWYHHRDAVLMDIVNKIEGRS